MTKTRQERIREIMDKAALRLHKEGVRHFIGVIDREDSTGGKVYVQSDVRGEDFPCLLEAAMPNRQDIVNLGIWVGGLIAARSKKQKED